MDGLLSRASRKLVSDEALLPELGPTRLDHDLQKYIWNGKPHLHLKDLWEYLNRYLYLPRIKNQQVLVKAVQAGRQPRVHRSISWIGRSEAADDDHDAGFLFLWIAFNAAYADEGALQGLAMGERAAFDGFFGKLVALDANQQIYNAIWQRFSGPIRNLMQNRYVFNPFWQFHNGVEGYEDWEDRFTASARSFAQAVQSGDTARVLSFVFDRLYVLRNQLIHGGATWNSAVNRAQVRDGTAILGFLMPVFVDIMMENPHKDWGQPFYPVID